MWEDEELLILMRVTDQLLQLSGQPDAQLRVLQYVKDRLGLPLLLIKARPLVPDADRCEEIGGIDFIG